MTRGKHLNCPVCGANVWAPHSILGQHWHLGTVKLCVASKLTFDEAKRLAQELSQQVAKT